MRFKLLCFIVPLKVVFVITLQYLAINISDTPWLSGIPTLVQGDERWLLREWACCLGSWSPIIARVGFGEGLLGTQGNVERGKEHPQKPGDPYCRLCVCHNYRSTNLGFRILTGKGKRFNSMTSQNFSNAKTMYSIINDQREKQSPTYGHDLDEFGY